MKKRILINAVLITFISILVGTFLFGFSQHSKTVKNLDLEMKNIAGALSDDFIDVDFSNKNDIKRNIEIMEYAHKYNYNFRFTWIKNNGDVLYDSDYDARKMDNHIGRKEIDDALDKTVGASTRYSKTLSRAHRYFAIKTRDGSILRVSKSIISPYALLANFFPIALGISILATLIILLVLSRTLNKNFKDMEKIADNIKDEMIWEIEEEDIPVADELLPLIRIIESQKKDISFYIKNLKDRIKTTNDILDNMNEGLVLLNKDDSIISINTSALELLDLPKSDYIGKNLMYTFRDKSLVENILRGTNQPFILEKPGKYLKIFLSPLIDSEGKFNGRIIFILDITKEYAEEKYRRDFTAVVSHELKTPLTSINGYAELISSGIAKEEDIKEFAKIIGEQGNKLLGMIDDIIKLSRLESFDEKQMVKSEINLFDMINQLVRTVRPIADNKNIEIITKVPRGLVLNSFPFLIDELIYNLVINAINYNVQGGSVNIGIHDNDDSIFVVISDTGIGIPKEDQDRVFERFYMVDKSRNKTNSRSSGLGLSIVKHIVLQLGGEINLKSELNLGTEVSVRLPK